jgi:UDP:flavonoid glycosyltransferase YjiC (YdhE family)
MRLTLLTIGSRGDVQPMLALGRELIAAGHEVTIATHPRFADLAARAEVPFAPIAEGRIGAGTATPEGTRWIRQQSRYMPTWVAYAKDARSVVRERLQDALVAVAGSDAVIVADLAILVGWQVSEHFGCPLIRVNLNIPAPFQERSGPLARALRGLVWSGMRRWLNGARRDVGLAPVQAHDPVSELDARHALVLQAFSPAIAPELRKPEWVHRTGFWFIDCQLDADPSPALVEFIDGGPPPVCVDFGSMADSDPDGTAAMVSEALARNGQRGVVLKSPHRSTHVRLPANMIAIGSTSHDWLLPRCTAFVSHGGAGSTAGALRAGIASVPIPHTEDQMRLARRMHRLGVAAEPIHRRRLNVESLTAGIRAACTDAALRGRALAMSQTLAAEHGPGSARALIEAYLSDRAPRVSPDRIKQPSEVA